MKKASIIAIIGAMIISLMGCSYVDNVNNKLDELNLALSNSDKSMDNTSDSIGQVAEMINQTSKELKNIYENIDSKNTDSVEDTTVSSEDSILPADNEDGSKRNDNEKTSDTDESKNQPDENSQIHEVNEKTDIEDKVIEEDGTVEEIVVEEENTEEEVLVDEDSDKPLKDYSIREIAKLNGLKPGELNVVYDDNGYIKFLGNSYGKEKIHNEDDALKSIDHLKTLLGIKDSTLVFDGVTKSSASGYKYYNFHQIFPVDYDGEPLNVEYPDLQVKVIVDKWNHSAGVSSSIEHDAKVVLAEVASAFNNVEEEISDEDFLETIELNSVSAEFFEGKEDAGDYKYEIDLSWIKEKYPSYAGEESMEVTVSVLHDKENDTYYLGDKDMQIIVANYADFAQGGSINPVISKNPKNPEDWGFLNSGSEDEPYRFYMDYVIGTYAATLMSADYFEESFEQKPIDITNKPVVLGVYSYDSVNDNFENNYDNCCLLKSNPDNTDSLSPKYMSTMLLDAVLKEQTKLNESGDAGALLNSFKDIIGCHTYLLNADNIEEEKWNIGGYYSPVKACMDNPDTMGMPKYFNGLYYANVDKLSGEMNELMANGGSDINKSVPEYLATKLVDAPKKDIKEKESLLSLENSFNLWNEVVYMSIQNSGIEELGNYLLFATDVVGLEDGEYIYANRLLADYGYLGTNKKYEKNLKDEDFVSLKYKVSTDDHNFFNQYNLGIYTYSENDLMNMSIADGKKNLDVKVDENRKISTSLLIGDKEGSVLSSLRLCTAKNAKDTTLVDIGIKEVSLDSGEIFTLSDKEKLSGLDDNCKTVENDLFFERECVFDEAGEYFLSTIPVKGEYGKFTVYHIEVKDTEIPTDETGLADDEVVQEEANSEANSEAKVEVKAEDNDKVDELNEDVQEEAEKQKEVIEKEVKEETVQEENVQSDEEQKEEIQDLKNIEEYSLNDIAKINGVSRNDLLTRFDEDGYLVFLGNSYCDDELNDSEEVLNSLNRISTLLGLEGVSLKFDSTYESIVSGYKYYTFLQEVDATLVDSSLLMIKVAVDDNNKTAAVSANIVHDIPAAEVSNSSENIDESVTEDNNNHFSLNIGKTYAQKNSVAASIENSFGDILSLFSYNTYDENDDNNDNNDDNNDVNENAEDDSAVNADNTELWIIQDEAFKIDFSNPTKNKFAKLIDGEFYVSNEDARFDEFLGEGIANINRGIIDYFSYMLVNESEEYLYSDEERLSLEDNRDLWYESSLMALSNNDFESQGDLLLYAAKVIDLSDRNIKFLNRMLDDYGFMGKSSEHKELLLEEDYSQIMFVFDYSDSKSKDSYDIAVIGLDDNDNWTGAGVVGRSGKIKNYVEEGDKVRPYIQILNSDSDEEMAKFELVSHHSAIDESKCNIYVKDIEVGIGETYTLEDNEELAGIDSRLDEYKHKLFFDNEFSVDCAGEYFFTTLSNESLSAENEDETELNDSSLDSKEADIYLYHVIVK